MYVCVGVGGGVPKEHLRYCWGRQTTSISYYPKKKNIGSLDVHGFLLIESYQIYSFNYE